jgi:hypothetical protein
MGRPTITASYRALKPFFDGRWTLMGHSKDVEARHKAGHDGENAHRAQRDGAMIVF